MDQVDDSLNDIMTSALQGPSSMDGCNGSGDVSSTGNVDVNDAIMNTHSSPVMAVAADLPSFQYFISEQAKSMLALQELQNEVGALLEFRDLVMEVFPELGQKRQTYSHAIQSQTALSPTKWEPGIRVKRKLNQQSRGDTDILVPSLLPRYRSNSQGKASRSSEVSGSAVSSAIQDSGFCTESNKDHSSAISSRSKSRETEDELFSLLDHIHHKGTRLKLEVEYLWNKANTRKGSLSLAWSNKRRCKSLDDLILMNGSAQTFTFECAMKTAFLETELNALKKERDLLLKKITEFESERRANISQTNQLFLELETISSEKRDLEIRLQETIHSGDEMNNRVEDLQSNFLSRRHWKGAQTPLAKNQLLNLMQVFKESSNQGISADESVSANHFLNSKNTVSSTSISNDDYFMPEHLQKNKNFCYALMEDSRMDRPANPMTKELNVYSYQNESHENNMKSRERDLTMTSVATLASTKDFNETTNIENVSRAYNRFNRDATIDLPGILIGFQSDHLPSIEPTNEGGITLSKEKVLSILNEHDPVTLHRFLLTLSYQLEVLNAHVQRVSNSRTNIFSQLEACRKENDKLKLELKLKEIELEGTKAENRELERMRNEKLCCAISDSGTTVLKGAMENIKTHPAEFINSTSDITFMNDKLPLNSLSINQNNSKYMDSRDSASKPKHNHSSRPSVSRIPLKTYTTSKLPNKMNISSSNKKTLTSFKECSVSQSSCISYTSSVSSK